jgi:hypothetical protein
MTATLFTIEQRLFHAFGFRLGPHMKTVVKEHGSLLDGVDFEAVDHAKLANALRAARDKKGRPAFAGKWVNGKVHVPLKASFGATKGEGFREIFYVGDAKPGELAMRGNANFSSMFAELPKSSRTSLHFAVSQDKCNVHVDKRDFVMVTPSGGVALTPDLADHTVNELLWKTLARDALDFLPPEFFDRTSFVLPNSANGYAMRVGFAADLKRAKSYKVTVKATCSLTNARDWSGTVNLRGVFDPS